MIDQKNVENNTNKDMVGGNGAGRSPTSVAVESGDAQSANPSTSAMYEDASEQATETTTATGKNNSTQHYRDLTSVEDPADKSGSLSYDFDVDEKQVSDEKVVHLSKKYVDVANGEKHDDTENDGSDGRNGKNGKDGDEIDEIQKVDENENKEGGEASDDDCHNSLNQIQSDFILQKDKSRRSVRLTSALLHYTRPEGLNLTPLGSSPSVDIFAIMNNGARRALIDLYNMIDCMRRHVEQMRTPTVILFFRWWKLLVSFLCSVLDAYQFLLIPWITNGSGSNEPVSVDVSSIRNEVLETIRLFDNIETHVSRRAPDETVARIIRALDHFKGLPKFFNDVENELPDCWDRACITNQVGDKDKQFTKMHKKILLFLHRKGEKGLRQMHGLVVERAMTVEEMGAWKRSVPMLVRLSSWVKSSKYDRKYVSVVRTICSIDDNNR